MDDRCRTFLNELSLKLTRLPEIEKMEALNYYEEYMNDALDEGVSLDELISRLDSPEKIAAMLLAETSIRKAQSSPGLKNYASVVKYARFNITRPLSIFLFSIIIFFTYSIAVTLFLGAVISAAAASVILPVFVYEALKMPLSSLSDIIGTIGAGVFGAGLFILTAYGFYMLCRWFIRLSTSLISRMLKKADRPKSDPGEYPYERSRISKQPLRAGLAIIAVGLIISLSTGLPVKQFMIYNSMKPANITVQEWSYDSKKVKTISLTTAHSHIRLKKGKSDKIEMEYEQADWLKPEISLENGKLKFAEVSNGSMPFFSLVTMHENRADLIIKLPADFSAEELKLESKGGFIHIESTEYAVEAKTYTGSIYLESEDSSAAGNIEAITSTGLIVSNGKNIGEKLKDGLKYHSESQIGNRLQFETERGNIYID